MVTVKAQGQVVRTQRERNTKSAAEKLLQPRAAFKPLAAVDHLWKVPAPPVHPGPELAAGCRVLSHGDDGRRANLVTEREGGTNQPTSLGEQPANSVAATFNDFSGIGDRRPEGEPFTEALADRGRKERPGFCTEKRAKPEIFQAYTWFGSLSQRLFRWSDGLSKSGHRLISYSCIDCDFCRNRNYLPKFFTLP